MSTEKTSEVADLKQDAIEQETPQLTAGTILHRAREEKGWLKEDIAARLNLRYAIIDDIENDIVNDQMSETFVRGYLRAYARLIGADEKQVLDAFDALGDKPQKPIKMQSFSRRTIKESNDFILKGVTWCVVAMILGSLILWWWQQDRQTNNVTSEANVSELVVKEAQAPSQDFIESESQQQFEQAEFSALETAAPVTIPEAASNPTPASTTEGILADTPVVKAERLKVTFIGDSWIKVTDGDSKVLALGVKNQGTELLLDGKQPFTVIMGIPKNVEIEFLGETVNKKISEARVVVSS